MLLLEKPLYEVRQKLGEEIDERLYKQHVENRAQYLHQIIADGSWSHIDE
jgi:hypothetical protein